ncbi:DUF3500 domain-containing protein [Spirosoma sp. HMF4905]|uniref:DUF3500 domain-containing protein n=1 Tax=Spirosoma arboris TaxID=2682092 RepID=A0A7K1SIW1_9BACT|nr:DUF3500 domain-containing protein [Spirosoma arboris]MVM33668.1 DUF3500 domain-containing protein [Spirosoma arboris]
MKSLSLLYSTGLVALSLTVTLQSQYHAFSTNPIPGIPLARIEDDCSSAKGLARIVCLAEAFKATLSADQVATVQRTYSKTDAAKWSNFPEFSERPRRVGIQLGSLNEVQLKAAKTLLAAAMAQNVPNEGFDELEGNLAADEYLGKLINKTSTFNAGNYYLAFLGTPSATGLWELQFGGHHFAVANTYKDGKAIGLTPSFRGVEPIAPVTINGRTHQSMEQERQAFADMLGSLTNAEQTTAKLSATFRDILLGPGADGQFPTTKQGIKVGTLSATQKKLVLNAIKLYVNDLDPATVATVLTNYTTDLDNTYVAFSGSGTMSQPGDYVRIDGPRVWIEYSGQPSRDIPGTVHPHSVWRDHTSDYGGN